ncbi:hypothetical protein ACFL96_06940, partial [Thermoproteota archaeon]
NKGFAAATYFPDMNMAYLPGTLLDEDIRGNALLGFTCYVTLHPIYEKYGPVVVFYRSENPKTRVVTEKFATHIEPVIKRAHVKFALDIVSLLIMIKNKGYLSGDLDNFCKGLERVEDWAEYAYFDKERVFFKFLDQLKWKDKIPVYEFDDGEIPWLSDDDAGSIETHLFDYLESLICEIGQPALKSVFNGSTGKKKLKHTHSFIDRDEDNLLDRLKQCHSELQMLRADSDQGLVPKKLKERWPASVTFSQKYQQAFYSLYGYIPDDNLYTDLRVPGHVKREKGYCLDARTRSQKASSRLRAEKSNYIYKILLGGNEESGALLTFFVYDGDVDKKLRGFYMIKGILTRPKAHFRTV